MQSLIVLPLGAALQALVFVLLHRLAGIGAKPAAVVVAFLALALALPYALPSS